MEKNPHPECLRRRNDIDDSIVAFVERYPKTSFSSILQSHEFDNQQTRASIRRLRRGGRIEVQHWKEVRVVDKAPGHPEKTVACHGFAIKTAPLTAFGA